MKDDQGRFILLDADIDGINMILVNIYAPTKDKCNDQLDFLIFIQNSLSEYIDKNLVIGGDFNTYLDMEKDKKGGKKETLSVFSKKLTDFIESFDLCDVWRVLNPDERKFTWRNHTRGGFVQSRIDYFFISTHMLYDLADTYIKPGIKSDHSLILLSFKLPKLNTVRGRGFWKFNASLLHDKEYVTLVKKVINDSNHKYSELDDKALLWDVMKCEIRSSTISFAAFKSKQKKIMLADLTNKLETLEDDLNKDDSVYDEYIETKSKLEKLLNDKAQGNYIRSRAIYVEFNEKSSKHFLHEENKNAKNKNITCLKTPDGRTLNDPNDILQEQKLFYQNLY